MFYTLTLNPALDHIVRLDDLKIGETNRMTSENIKSGGKGINVSKILKNLGEKSIALGFIAGFTGLELEKKINEDFGLATDFIKCKKGFTRINVKIKANSETEINGPGPQIEIEEKNLLFDKLKKIKEDDYLFLSGSIPHSLGDDFYEKIMESLKDKKANVIVDASGASLKNSLKYNPFLIKPNLRELEEIFNVEIKDKNEISHYAKKLQELGAKNIIVSLGKDGAYMIDSEGNEYYRKAFSGNVVDTVGSGDSMVAGFTYAIKNGYSTKEAFKFSLACGSATAFSKDLATREEIFELYKKL